MKDSPLNPNHESQVNEVSLRQKLGDWIASLPVISSAVAAMQRYEEKKRNDRQYADNLRKYNQIIQKAPRMPDADYRKLPYEIRGGQRIRSTAQRYNTSEEFEAEYATQSLLHAAAPEHFLKPRTLLTLNNQVVGFVMDNAEGSSLYRVALHHHGTLPIAIKDQVEKALRSIHASGLVHGAVSADNIRVTPEENHVYLLDPSAKGPQNLNDPRPFDQDIQAMNQMFAELSTA